MANIQVGDWFRIKNIEPGAPLIRVESIGCNGVVVSDWSSFGKPWTYQFQGGPTRKFGYGYASAMALLEKYWKPTSEIPRQMEAEK